MEILKLLILLNTNLCAYRILALNIGYKIIFDDTTLS